MIMAGGKTDPLVEHIEKHLGKISISWITEDISVPGKIQIIKFMETPAKGITTFITLGLSKHLLQMPSGKKCRQELVICANSNSNAEDLISILLMLGYRTSVSHKAILRGGIEYIGRSLTENPEMSYLYACVPFVFPESFDLLSTATYSIMFPLLIPIYDKEAEIIGKNKKGYFEKILDEQETDLFDIKRPMLNMA